MEQADLDPVGPFRRFLLNPATGWLCMGALVAVGAWVSALWAGKGDPLLQLVLGAMLGMGGIHTQVHALRENDLSIRLRIWTGLFDAIWLAAFLGLMAMAEMPEDFAVSAVVAGGIFGAMMAMMAKPYPADRFAFLDLEETTVFQRGTLQAWLAALWPGAVIGGAAAELYYRKSVPYAVFFMAGALNLAPPYRFAKPDPGKARVPALLGGVRMWVLLALVILAWMRLRGMI